VEGRDFCCQGCLTVFEFLHENGLGDFYRLAERPGVQVKSAVVEDRFAYLDEPVLRDRLLDYSDGQMARVTFQVPAIHCVACVWLLENLFKLRPGIGRSVVDFGKQQVTITFETGRMRLSELAALLTSIGYEPTLRLDSLDRPQARSLTRSLYLRLGVAGFAFGNIMLFSVCLYSGMDRFSVPVFKPLFGWVSLGLALPVLVYSAGSYWRGAWLGLRQRTLTLDFPIALGLLALFGQSLYEVVSGRGVGYLDSMAGLVFFLLIGRVFQDRTYQHLSFDRDYKSFFPLAVRRVEAAGERTVPLSALAVGDRLRLRQGELIPADARVREGSGLIDYSFVTGESEPVQRSVGDWLYAGGQPVGGAMDIEIIKPVSQSYLTSLWSHEAFAKQRGSALHTLLNRFSRGFTLRVVVLALAAGAWWWAEDPSRAIRAFTSVLIVACPCALALSAPFALGTAQRWLGRFGVFTRNAQVMEDLARVNAVVFDKTGTLTSGSRGNVRFRGDPLSDRERGWIQAVAARSAHPNSVRLAAWLSNGTPPPLEGFEEVAGCGVRARVEGHEVRLGSSTWVNQGLESVGSDGSDGSVGSHLTGTGTIVHVALGGRVRGWFELGGALRPRVDQAVAALARSHELVLLSGDNGREREKFEALLGPGSSVRFDQSPADKLAAIAELQKGGRSVLMVGDGLNDAGALRQCDVGLAVVEQVGTFSPASDVIMEAGQVPGLAAILRFAQGAVRVVWASIGISLLYNVIGLAFAASGRLSPIVCAILMPLSSVSVVAFACGAVGWMSRRAGLAVHLDRERTS
jgi:Cu+-exporting ATPase